MCVGDELPVGYGYEKQPCNNPALNEQAENFQVSARALGTSARVTAL